MIEAAPDVAALFASLALAARVFGVLLFATAAWSKLRNFTEFASIMARYLRAPLGPAKIASIAVIGLELAAVALLAMPGMQASGAALAIALLLCFAGAMGIALLRGERELDCGCMSTALRQRVRPALVLRNVLLAGVMIAPLVAAVPSSDVLTILNGIAAGAVLFVLNIAFGLLVALGDSFAELKRRYG